MEIFEQEKINQIIVAYLEGVISNDDLVLLENWIKTSDENRKYFLQLKNISEVTKTNNKISDSDTKSALKKVLSRISENSTKVIYWRYIQRAAAILLLPVIVGSIIWNLNASRFNKLVGTYINTYAVYGTRTALVLPDGTNVWLNSGSSLRYPDKFITNNREVYLNGEAYFEVRSDKSKPFTVLTPSISVKATGTKFNVAAYENSNSVEVSLLTGKVTVKKIDAGNQKSVYTEMEPNQHLTYNKLSQNSKITNQDVSKFIAWKEGKLIFRNEPLLKVIQKISQSYNVEIELQGKELQEYRYRATFEDESLDEILKLLKHSSPIDYKEVDRKLLPDGTFSKRKIIIYFCNKKSKNK